MFAFLRRMSKKPSKANTSRPPMIEPMAIPAIARPERPEALCPIADGAGDVDTVEDVEAEDIPLKDVAVMLLSVSVMVGGKEVDVVRTVVHSVDMMVDETREVAENGTSRLSRRLGYVWMIDLEHAR